MVWGLALMLTGLVTWMAGKIIQAAVSREREYLADATSIQYTREPEAMANALRKKALENKAQEKPDQAQMAFNKRKEACAHMFFFNVSEIFTSGPLATHPTIEKRLEAILDREVNLEDELKRMPALQGKLHPTQLT